MAAICEHCSKKISHRDSTRTSSGYSYHAACYRCFVCGDAQLRGGDALRGVLFCRRCADRFFGCRDAELGGVRVLRSNQTLKYSGDDSLNSELDDRSSFPDKIAACEPKLEVLNVSKMTNISQGIQTSSATNHDISTNDSNYVPTNSIRKRCIDDESDLRIAEIGASVEVANMGLREKSDKACINPDINLTTTETSGSSAPQTSDTIISEKAEVNNISSPSRRFTDKRLSSILKFPIVFFKNEVLSSSSIVEEHIRYAKKISGHKYDKEAHKRIYRRLKELKNIFKEDVNIPKHRAKGLRDLYPVINQKNKETLGWLRIKPKGYCHVHSGDCTKHPVTCRHYRRSHEYRCMRRQAMRLAGPTKSQLLGYRTQIKQLFSFRINDRGDNSNKITCSHGTSPIPSLINNKSNIQQRYVEDLTSYPQSTRSSSKRKYYR